VEDTAPPIADLAAYGVTIRKQHGLTQVQFCPHFGLDVAALRNWEAGRREPYTATRSYLRVIECAPAQVEDTLWAG
jgi:DNA-binding transcriptional regulator YiaG